ncbi:hypothetical protein [Xanthocytophaga agilis]|uniref:Uncharacterized protein n=1 Tax=Xanthocytophaga agilis TaxID=3048010 RepID=A0AAE3R273_9BACT|nr:hypothetical protein [Xanthocytophaga agilis]MDJ1500254.1 hypothetical protein [Xanthocytophaga agilis]
MRGVVLTVKWQITLFFIFILLAGFTAKAQNQEIRIKEIRQKYTLIHQQLFVLDTVQKDLEGSSEGGSVTGFYKSGKLLAMKATYYGETGYVTTEYYLENGNSFFILRQEHRYNRPMYYDKKAAQENNDPEAFDSQKTTVKEDRFYMHNQILIRWINSSSVQVVQSSSEYKYKAQELLTETASLQSQLDN